MMDSMSFSRLNWFLMLKLASFLFWSLTSHNFKPLCENETLNYVEETEKRYRQKKFFWVDYFLRQCWLFFCSVLSFNMQLDFQFDILIYCPAALEARRFCIPALM